MFAWGYTSSGGSNLWFTVLVAIAAAGERDTDSRGQLPAGGSSVTSSIRDDGEVLEDAAAVEQLDTKSEAAGSSAAANILTDGCAYHLAFYTSRRLGAGTSAQVRQSSLRHVDSLLIPFHMPRCQTGMSPDKRPVPPRSARECWLEQGTCTHAGLRRADWPPRYHWAAAAA